MISQLFIMLLQYHKFDLLSNTGSNSKAEGVNFRIYAQLLKKNNYVDCENIGRKLTAFWLTLTMFGILP